MRLTGVFIMENQNEIWKDVLGYENFYQVSNFGNVRSITRTIINSKGKKRTYIGKMIRQKDNGNGYLQVHLCKQGKEKIFYVHRLIISAFNGSSEMDCDHINCIRNDNRISNLHYVTKRFNQSKRTIKRVLPVGVYRHGKKFRSIIYANGKSIRLGTHATIKEAHYMYLLKLKEYE